MLGEAAWVLAAGVSVVVVAEIVSVTVLFALVVVLAGFVEAGLRAVASYSVALTSYHSQPMMSRRHDYL